MQTFTLSNAGLMPGINFRKTFHNLQGVPVGITEDNKANTMLIVTPQLVEAFPDGIVRDCSVIQDGSDQYLGYRCANDDEECLVFLCYGRGQKSVLYTYQTPGQPMTPLATLVEQRNSPAIAYGFSDLPNDDMGLEAVVRLSKGDKIVCKAKHEAPMVLSWTGNKISKQYVGQQRISA